jgi:hypothetical protein
LRFLKKLNIDLLYDSAIPLLGIYLEECKSIYKGDTYISTFIAALFTVVKLWNQARYPTIDECIKKRWYTYMEYYFSNKEK